MMCACGRNRLSEDLRRTVVVGVARLIRYCLAWRWMRGILLLGFETRSLFIFVSFFEIEIKMKGGLVIAKMVDHTRR